MSAVPGRRPTRVARHSIHDHGIGVRDPVGEETLRFFQNRDREGAAPSNNVAALRLGPSLTVATSTRLGVLKEPPGASRTHGIAAGNAKVDTVWYRCRMRHEAPAALRACGPLTRQHMLAMMDRPVEENYSWTSKNESDDGGC